MTESAMPTTFSQVSASSGTVPNTAPPNWVMTTCSARQTAKEPSINLFLKKLGKMLPLPSSRQLKALNSWKKTNRVKMTVPIRSSPTCKKSNPICKRQTAVMYTPPTAMRRIISPERMFSPRGVGRRCIRSPRMGSSPRVRAGGPSMMMLIHSRSRAEKGESNPATPKVSKTVHKKTMSTAATLTVSWNWMKRLKFS